METPDPTAPLILIVEDNPSNLLLARAVLHRAGYRTDEARSAAEALARLQTARPDLILMDVQLPGMDGLALTRRLKSDPGTAGIPVVALTAHAMPGDRERAMAAGCESYVAKPIDTRTLAGELAAVLDQARDGGPGDD